MVGKRSQHELRRLVEHAVADVCGLPRPGLWFCVDKVEARGQPPERLTVWATLHFLPEGSPFCCGEPGCHLGLCGERAQQVSEHVRRAMHRRQRLSVDFDDRIGVDYHAGVTFHDGRADA
ncbi:MAG: hypothetical protein HY721_03010 [Planctomycetes bacterium]|nr:hypothetical protein [Planctomycetota bacterium]